MNKSYDRKVVIVTGASRGIGSAIAEIFAKNNYNVVVNFVQSTKAARQICDNLSVKYHIEAIPIQADISKEEDVKKLINTTHEKFGHIDCLVNNAGIAIDTTLEDKTVTNFQKILNTNLVGPFLTCKYVGQIMLSQKEGSIINISSTNAIDSFYPYSMDYDASKAGVISLTHNFAKEYAPTIRVNCIAPGWVETDMNKNLDKDYISSECEHILLKRFAKPEEIADLVYFVANSTYINDSIIKIDGGRC